MDANLLRTINKLWKDRHTHDGEDFQEQITIIRQTVEQQGDQVAASGTGAHLHLIQTAHQEIGVGGEAIEWDSVLSVIPAFEFDDTVPVTAIPVSKSGYYDIHAEFEWETFLGGGTVAIVRTRAGAGTVVWPSPAAVNWTSTSAQKFSGTAKAIPFVEGDTFEVFVDHGEGSGQEVGSAVLAVELVDRYTVEPDPESSEQLFIFTEDGTFDWVAAGSPATVDVWIVAGGGGGGSSDGEASWRGGGGGAGGVLILEDYPVSANCAVVVGLGGAGEAGGFDGGDGEDSSFDGESATGGGGGGGKDGLPGRDGGSGGGAASTAGPVGSGVAGQGNDGGLGDSGGGSRAGGGGGGAGQAGQDAEPNAGLGGDGGDGIDLSALVGTDYGEAGWFAGGGGGGSTSSSATAGAGGRGGGGGLPNVDGLVNSGGGGGGTRVGGTAGDGGSGIVIVRVGG